MCWLIWKVYYFFQSLILLSWFGKTQCWEPTICSYLDFPSSPPWQCFFTMLWFNLKMREGADERGGRKGIILQSAWNFDAQSWFIHTDLKNSASFRQSSPSDPHLLLSVHIYRYEICFTAQHLTFRSRFCWWFIPPPCKCYTCECVKFSLLSKT